MSGQPAEAHGASASLTVHSLGDAEILVEVVDGEVFITIANPYEDATAYLSPALALTIAEFITEQLARRPAA